MMSLPTVVKVLTATLQLILTEQPFAREQQYRRLDGQIVDVEVNANLISDNGRDVFCIIVHDITQRKLIENQLLHDAFHDSLTGLANRAYLWIGLYYALEKVKQCKSRLLRCYFRPRSL
jgi:PleD family two-component response regulator